MKEIKLKDVAKVVIGISAPKNFIKENDFNAVPFIRAGLLEDLSNGKENYIEYLNRDNYKIVPKNTVIFAKSGMSALKNRVYCLRNDSVIVGHLAGIICNHKQLYFKYLEYYLKYNKPSQLNQNDSYPSIRTEDIENIMIKLPEFEVQQEIAKKLDCLNNLISIRKKQIEELDQLIKSQFVEMFESIKYPKIKLGDEFDISSGGTPSKNRQEYWNSNDISWIGSNMCQNKIIYENDGKYISYSGLENSSAKIYPIDTILIALVGATIGKTALLKFETATNQNIAGIQVSERFIAEYVYFAIQNLYYKFTELGKGTFKMANLSFIRNLEISMPPIKLQYQFANIVKQIDKQKVKLQKSLEEIEKLQENLMNKYFS